MMLLGLENYYALQRQISPNVKLFTRFEYICSSQYLARGKVHILFIPAVKLMESMQERRHILSQNTLLFVKFFKTIIFFYKT